MIAKCTKRNKTLFGYDAPTRISEVDPDIKELYKMASPKKLWVLGGLHGHENTGRPTGQYNSEESSGSSFSFEDRMVKGVGSGINFTYKNPGKYTTDGSDVSRDKLDEIVGLVTDLIGNGHYVLLPFCWSRVWIQSEGL